MTRLATLLAVLAVVVTGCRSSGGVDSSAQVAWRHDFDASVLLIGGAADSARVYLDDDDGTIFALSRATGREVWRAQAGSATRAVVGVRDGVVLAQDARGVLHAFDSSTGRRLWQHESDETGAHPIAVAVGVVAVSIAGELTGLDLHTGRVRWTLPLDRSFVPAGRVASDGTRFYALGAVSGVEADRLLAVAPLSGAVVTQARLLVPQPPFTVLSAGAGVVLVGDGNDPVTAYDARTLHRRWVSATVAPTDVSAAVEVGDSLYLGRDGKAWAVASAGGSATALPREGHDLGDPGRCGPVACYVSGTQLVTVDARGQELDAVTLPHLPGDDVQGVSGAQPIVAADVTVLVDGATVLMLQ